MSPTSYHAAPPRGLFIVMGFDLSKRAQVLGFSDDFARFPPASMAEPKSRNAARASRRISAPAFVDWMRPEVRARSTSTQPHMISNERIVARGGGDVQEAFAPGEVNQADSLMSHRSLDT